MRKKSRRLTPFGVMVKKKLIDLGMTQAQLARRVGTSDMYLNLILYGERSGAKYLNGIINTLELDAKNHPLLKYLYHEQNFRGDDPPK